MAGFDDLFKMGGAIGATGAGGQTSAPIFAALGINLGDSNGLLGNRPNWMDTKITGLNALGGRPGKEGWRAQISADLAKMNQDGLAQLSGQSLVAPLATPGSSGGSSGFEIG